MKSRLTALRLFVAALSVAGHAAAPAFSAPVRTESGLVEGVAENGVTVFRGLPYAAAPVGSLRWRAPEPPASWEGVRAAERFSPICPQKGMYPEDSPPESMSEDCLYLNIWTPAPAGASEKLPVMVWVHGGGLVNGSGSTPLYHGDRLARRGVIVVTFNYRLGALGFLAHPDLSQESSNKVSGNYGHCATSSIILTSKRAPGLTKTGRSLKAWLPTGRISRRRATRTAKVSTHGRNTRARGFTRSILATTTGSDPSRMRGN